MNNKRKGLYCRTEQRQAYLSSDFGLSFAMRHLNKSEEELISIVGRYTKGKRKGLLKGSIQWHVVTVGGWLKSEGCVVSPGIILNIQLVDAWTSEPIRMM